MRFNMKYGFIQKIFPQQNSTKTLKKKYLYEIQQEVLLYNEKYLFLQQNSTKS
jgi:hypothetical protein